MAGLSGKEIAEIAALDPAHFDAREWVALNWVRAFMENGGRVPGDVDSEFRATFTPRERSYVLATHKAMLIANLSSNTMQKWFNRLRRKPPKPPESCRIDL